jgi:ABC-2 type transport system permease protein
MSTWLSLFPTFTPLLMLFRQSTPGGVPIWQPIVGLFGMLLFTIIFVWAGGRIFRVGILTQGGSVKIANIIRWAIKG